MENCTIKEIAVIEQKIRVIKETNTADWPKWVKLVSGLYQLTSGDFRLYFHIYGKSIIICHMCRKVGQKAEESDLYRAKQNWKNYLESRK